MSDQPRESSTFVSLQSGPREPGAGVHVARGALLRSDLAVFAVPRHVELRSDMRLHVLVSPIGPGESDVIERILPRLIDVTSLEADPLARVAVVRLANPSRYAGPGSDRESPEALQARLAPLLLDGASLPQALAEAGLLPSQSAGAPVERILADIVRIELLQARHLITYRLGRLPPDIAGALLRPELAPAWPPSLVDPWDGLALAPG